MATHMYSIWLEPPAGTAIAAKSADFIKAQAARIAGAPLFVPHVTLAGGFVGAEDEIRVKTRQLASELGSEAGPLFWGAECEVQDVAIGQAYFQCVYMRMVPSSQLAKAHEMAAAAFGIPAGNGLGKPYMPHLSLVYGDLTAEEREGVAAAAKDVLGSDSAVNAGFTADRIALWRTDISDRSCRSWERVDFFPLQGSEVEV